MAPVWGASSVITLGITHEESTTAAFLRHSEIRVHHVLAGEGFWIVIRNLLVRIHDEYQLVLVLQDGRGPPFLQGDFLQNHMVYAAAVQYRAWESNVNGVVRRCLFSKYLVMLPRCTLGDPGGKV